MLEYGRYFTHSVQAQGQLREYELHYRAFCRQYVEKVKAILEGTSAVSREWTAAQ